MASELQQASSSVPEARPEQMARPVLKWAGGKQALARFLVDLFPREIDCYYEPFLGGASVLLMLNPERAIVGDLNGWLLDTYLAVRGDWRSVARALDRMENTKGEYLRIRSIDPGTLPAVRRAAHLIYLNKTCFRGLFRVNRKGQFNVPYGAYNRRYFDPDNLRAVAERLRKAEIRSGDFELCINDVSADDFIYFDPPYFKLGGYSDFNRYTAGQFRASDHLRLAAVCRELNERCVRWAVTNSETPFVRKLFDGFNIRPIASRREINLNSRNRGMTELLITNY